MKYTFEINYHSDYISYESQELLRDALKRIIINEYPEGSKDLKGLKMYTESLKWIAFCMINDELPEYVSMIVNSGKRWKR